MKSHLLVRPDKAGDAIKSLPAIRLALKYFPNDKFSVLCSSYNASLFAFEPKLRVFQLPKQWEELSSEALASFLKGLPVALPFNTATSLLSDVFPSVEKLMELIPSEERFSFPSIDGNAEEIKIATILSNALGKDLVTELSSVPRAPHYSSLDEEEAKAALGPKEGVRIAFCPFAGTEQRSHSDRRWRSFLKGAARLFPKAEFLLLGSSSERDRLAYLKNKNPQITIHCPSSFRTLGAYLKEMDGVVAVDSGPLHLAQAMGVPSLGILSGGDFKRWFSRLSPQDLLVERGFLFRHPNLIQMLSAFKKWSMPYRGAAR